MQYIEVYSTHVCPWCVRQVAAAAHGEGEIDDHSKTIPNEVSFIRNGSRRRHGSSPCHRSVVGTRICR